MRFETVTAGLLTFCALAGCANDASSGDVPAADAAEVAVQTEAPAQMEAPGQAVAVEGGEYRDIIIPELQAMLENKDFALINVHTPYAGDIPGTDESIPYDEISTAQEQLPADKDARIVVYCRTGPMSQRAARDLVALGYTNVYNVVGGFSAWAEAGLPLDTQ